jgi:hypothetical protein
VEWCPPSVAARANSVSGARDAVVPRMARPRGAREPNISAKHAGGALEALRDVGEAGVVRKGALRAAPVLEVDQPRRAEVAKRAAEVPALAHADARGRRRVLGQEESAESGVGRSVV